MSLLFARVYLDEDISVLLAALLRSPQVSEAARSRFYADNFIEMIGAA